MTRIDLHDRIQSQRKLREAQGRVRPLRTFARRDGMKIEVDGKWLVNFASEDYLGLSQHFQVVAALQDTVGREGIGGTGPHLAGNRHALEDELERQYAHWLGYPAALLFESRYAANLAVQQALLCEDGDVCVQDRLNHASLLDASALAGCRLRRFPHRDSEGALRQLAHAPDGAALLATDGVFGMDGDIAPLRSLALVAQRAQALLCIDDSHGMGVVGEAGRGSAIDAGLTAAEAPLQVAALNKALGGHGAILVGDADLLAHISQTARAYLYGSALSPAQMAASLAALQLARRDHWRRDRLKELIHHFREAARRLGVELMPSDTAIQPVLCGDEMTVTAVAATLEANGLLVNAVHPPIVPEGRARLRITLSTLHTPEQLEQLLYAIARVRELISPVQPLGAVHA